MSKYQKLYQLVRNFVQAERRWDELNNECVVRTRQSEDLRKDWCEEMSATAIACATARTALIHYIDEHEG